MDIRHAPKAPKRVRIDFSPIRRSLKGFLLCSKESVACPGRCLPPFLGECFWVWSQNCQFLYGWISQNPILGTLKYFSFLKLAISLRNPILVLKLSISLRVVSQNPILGTQRYFASQNPILVTQRYFAINESINESVNESINQTHRRIVAS